MSDEGAMSTLDFGWSETLMGITLHTYTYIRRKENENFQIFHYFGGPRIGDAGRALLCS